MSIVGNRSTPAVAQSVLPDLASKLGLAAAAASPSPAAASTPPATAGNVPPALTEDKPGFHTDPLVYSADIATNLANGPTNTARNLPGTFDASLTYLLGRTTRASASYYQFSAYPLGNDDEIPIVFQGTHTPIGYINGNKQGIAADTHLRFQVYTLQQMFFIGGRHHPLILAPFYGTVRSSIGGVDDTQTIFDNNRFDTVHLRSYQTHGADLAIPLFYYIDYLVSYTGSVTWNGTTNGANLTNHPQYQQSLYGQYKPTERTTLFANAATTVAYFPSDVYPYHSATFHYGVAQVVKAPVFVEAEVSTSGPMNPNYYGTGRIGIPELVVPCASTAAGGPPTAACVAAAGHGIALPALGAQRVTTFSLILGIGAHPLVQPF